MDKGHIWNPLNNWKHTDIHWVKADIRKEDLRRLTKRSNRKGLLQSLGFLLLIASTGSLAYYTFSRGHFVFFAILLYMHGTFYAFFGNGLHELSHNTVFASRWLNTAMTVLYGWLYWPFNPYLYRLSHHFYHHRYTLYQGSDGEDVPNYVHLNARFIIDQFFHVIHVTSFIHNIARLLTLKPTSKGWRGRGFRLDTWEQFVMEHAKETDRLTVKRFAVFCLVSHGVFVAFCLSFGLWYLPVLITFAPFYGAPFLLFVAGIHQHAACDANTPDFTKSCGDAILDPLTSFLYWHMEYHIEHHMYAGIPCYNLKKFSQLAADQLPPKEHALPHILKLHRACQAQYGNWQNWRDNFGLYKGY